MICETIITCYMSHVTTFKEIRLWGHDTVIAPMLATRLYALNQPLPHSLHVSSTMYLLLLSAHAFSPRSCVF